MKRLAQLSLLLVLMLPASGFARTASAPIKLTMLVTGSVTVNPDGSVKSYAIDHANQLPQGVQNLLVKTLPGWTFDAVKSTGTAIPANTPMSVRVTGTVTAVTKQKVAGKTVQQNTVQIGIDDIALHCPPPHAEFVPALGCDPNANLRFWPDDKPPELPKYPLAAVRLASGGAVHLYLEIDSAGHVMQAAVGRVDLYAQISRPDRLRKILGDAALETAQYWQFSVPTTGLHAVDGLWVASQTIKFQIAGDQGASTGYGHWLAYLPGPAQAISWVDPDSAAIIPLPDKVVTASLIPDPRGTLGR